MPYTAFDLTLTGFDTNYTGVVRRNYFPLKRASSTLEYVLGRVFLQNTYVSVDYERAHFNLSQAYPEGGSTRVIAIQSLPDSTTAVLVPSASTPSTGASVEIGIGVAIVVLAAIGILTAWRKKRGIFRVKQSGEEQERTEKAEMDGIAEPWVEAMPKERTELEAQEPSQEVAGSQAQVIELEGSSAFHELAVDCSYR